MPVLHRLLIGLVLLPLLLLAGPGQTQESAPLVVFIDDSNLETASVLDSGPDGLTRLEALFVQLGARTARASLNEPFAEDAAVMVLVRPRQRLTDPQIARLFVQIERGSSLLLALDPSGHIDGSTDNADSGIMRLLLDEYGTRLYNGIIIEPGFSQRSLRTLPSSLSRVAPDPVGHPITDSLLAYGLPLHVWGARPAQVEPFGVDSHADSLLTVVPTFVEENSRVFRDRNADSLELNWDRDRVGRVLVGTAAENLRTNTRLVLLGDSEIVQNDFGLAQSLNTGLPLHPGNIVLTGNIAAWLLGLPPSDWPPLPGGFTWLAVDGDATDWDAALPTVTDATPDSTLPGADLTGVRAFRNDDFLYLLGETADDPLSDVALRLSFDINADGTADINLVLTRSGSFFQGLGGGEFPIPDAALAIASTLEVRLPRRTLIANAALTNICLLSGTTAGTAPFDCLDQPITPTIIDEADPVTLRYDPPLLVTVQSPDVAAVRTGPSFGFPEFDQVPARTVLGAIGRTADNQWVQVQTARYVGWMAAGSVLPNGMLDGLPVIEVQQ